MRLADEIDEGWLALTHGGPCARTYRTGAALRPRRPDEGAPRTAEPILAPSDDDQGGYVLSVVYGRGMVG